MIRRTRLGRLAVHAPAKPALVLSASRAVKDLLKVCAQQLIVQLRRKRVRRTTEPISIYSVRQLSSRARAGEQPTEREHERDQDSAGLDQLGITGSPVDTELVREGAEQGVVVGEGETAGGDGEGEEVESFASGVERLAGFGDGGKNGQGDVGRWVHLGGVVRFGGGDGGRREVDAPAVESLARKVDRVVSLQTERQPNPVDSHITTYPPAPRNDRLASLQATPLDPRLAPARFDELLQRRLHSGAVPGCKRLLPCLVPGYSSGLASERERSEESGPPSAARPPVGSATKRSRRAKTAAELVGAAMTELWVAGVSRREQLEGGQCCRSESRGR